MESNNWTVGIKSQDVKHTLHFSILSCFLSLTPREEMISPQKEKRSLGNDNERNTTDKRIRVRLKINHWTLCFIRPKSASDKMWKTAEKFFCNTPVCQKSVTSHWHFLKMCAEGEIPWLSMNRFLCVWGCCSLGNDNKESLEQG